MQRKENQTVALLHFGGLGDLVLSSELIVSLKSAYPRTKITLVCKQEFASLPELFPMQPDAVIGLELNPHLVDRPSEALRQSLQQIPALFTGFQPDLLVECSLRPTWLSFFLNSLMQPAKSFCCALESRPAALLPIVLGWFSLADLELPNLGLPNDLPEADRYGLLIDALALPRVRSFPWQPPSDPQARADDWLEANGMPVNGFVACFPGGSPGSEIKRWPTQNFIRALDAIRERGIKILLLGSTEEREYLSRISYVLEQGPVAVFADSIAIQLFASLLSRAAVYLANDTGPAHLAQAYGVPGVAIFGGGGQWPRYSSWAPGSIAVVHPLPCFGCNWDCFLGHGLCVESIPVEPVVDALFNAMNGKREPPAALALKTLDSQVLGLIADASNRYRVAALDRSQRMASIVELVNANQALTADNRFKKDELERAATRAGIIEEMTTALQESDNRNASLSEDLSGLERDRAEDTRRFQAEVVARDAHIAEIQRVADERLAVLEALHEVAGARARALEEVTAALRERDLRLGEMERRLEAVNATTEELRTQMSTIQSLAAAHLAEIDAAHRELAASDLRIAGLGHELAGRDVHIAAIYKIAEERLAVLERTHLEAAKRLSIIEEMSAAIEERDRRIAGLEQRLTARIGRFVGDRLGALKKSAK